MKKGKTSTMRPETVTIHAGLEPPPPHGAVSVPIYQTSTFSFASADEGAARFAGGPGYKYTRLGNPTNAALQEAVATLEGGYSGLGTSSGMAAVSTVMLTFLDAGSHVVGTDAVYGPTRVFATRDLSRFGIESDWVHTDRIEEIRKAIRPETKMIYIETPANPTIKLSDIKACAEIAHEIGSVLVVDNTFSTPLLQRPIELGADVVLHSMTKYLNGHADVVAGMIVSSSEEMHQRLAPMLEHLGGTMDPHQAWLVLRGMRTLAMRVEKAQQNAGRLAEWLESHPQVTWVNYPGLASHPQHELMQRQMAGPGSMIAFGVAGGLEAGKALINEVRLCTRAVSLGGVETLIEHPASMTHASMSPEARAESGIKDDLVRLAVGCEAYEDLRLDLEHALATTQISEISKKKKKSESRG
jgi:methionine-gamma-lyase